jgi:glycosyltransferase involved in cell wall biosynthesis
MRPVVVVGSFPPPLHGASFINKSLLDALSTQNIDAGEIDIAPSPPFHHLSRFVRTLRGVAKILAAKRSRYIVSADGGLGLLYNLLLVAAMRLRQSEIVIYHHSTRYVFENNAAAALLFRLAGPRTLHVACSETMLKLLTERYGLSVPRLVLSNSAWVRSGSPAERAPHKQIVLGHLSNLCIEKGLSRTIHTLRTLRNNGHEATLILAGDAANAEAAQIMRRAQKEFGSDLIYLGHVDTEAKNEFFSKIDYFLFPSLYPHETQSLVVPEAMAAGVPVIVYRHRYAADLVHDGGLAIPTGQDFATIAADWIAATHKDAGVYAKAALKAFQQDRERALKALDVLLAS